MNSTDFNVFPTVWILLSTGRGGALEEAGYWRIYITLFNHGHAYLKRFYDI